MLSTIDCINETANKLQYLYRLPRARRLRQREQFAVLRSELKALWQQHRREQAVISARQPLVNERMSRLDSISYDELGDYTPNTRRNVHIHVFTEVLREVLAELPPTSKPCHEQPLKTLHTVRGKPLLHLTEKNSVSLT